MKKLIFYKFTLIVITVILALQCSAECNSYYIMRKKDHSRPDIEPNFSYMSEYGGYYLGPDEKVIYLTFDAGYENGNVERIVDTLDKHNAKGTFFVLENIIKRNTDLIKKMAENGHTVANHSLHHKDMTTLDFTTFKAEIEGLEKLYFDLTGYEMAKFYRPPEGRFSKQSLIYAQKLGYKTVFWSFAYADWDNNRQPGCNYAYDLIINNTHNGEIILLHPTSKTNADILDRLLTEWEREGYRFGTLDELC